MPFAPKTPCRYPGCKNVVDKPGYCPEHQRVVAKRFERGRESAHKRGYNRRWKRLRIAFLAEHPLCMSERHRSGVVPATEVDHRVPHKGDPELFWDIDNLQALCKPCHSEKTAREDGRWG